MRQLADGFIGHSNSINMDTAFHYGETFEEKLATIASFLASKNNIIVLVGAGISVSCGIPDFRSENGLYNTLDYQELGLTCPEDLFDIETFRDDPRPFFKFAHSLYPGSIEPGPTHKFLASLDRQKKLLRVYTQNIDSLEQLAGVRSEKIIYAHGSLSNATCMKCKATYSAIDIASDVQLSRVPLCHRPRTKKAKLIGDTSTEQSTQSIQSTTIVQYHSMSLRRSSTKPKSADTYEQSVRQGLCGGVIKPNVTFFGEKLDNSVGRSLEKDYERADALLVMGTSLSVAPMSKVVTYLRCEIPRILINRTIVRVPTSDHNDFLFNACLLGNCDDVVEALEALGPRMRGLEITTKTANDLDCIDSGNLVLSGEAWLRNHPKECILLFPGAEVTNSNGAISNQLREIVHCDSCQLVVEGSIYCCKVCFDYDLCPTCYSTAVLTHANGSHEFRVEKCYEYK